MLLSLPAVAAPPKPKDAKARRHYDRAIERWEAQDFDAAAKEAEASFAIENNDGVLYFWAQAERKRDNCIKSVELSNLLIDRTDDETVRTYSIESNAWCAERLAEIARAAEQTETTTEASVEPEPQDDLTTLQDEPGGAATSRPWYRDPLGGVLVGVGGTALLTGGGLLIAAIVLDPD
ncbi:MAG: hypothetical protein AB1Z98_09415, partial [Nannocystaceae bacterium]